MGDYWKNEDVSAEKEDIELDLTRRYGFKTLK